MIIVTGGAGFIGANVIAKLNEAGHENILVIDDLSDGRKFRNLANLKINDYRDKSCLLCSQKRKKLIAGSTAVFHLGACSATSEWDGKYLMENNFRVTKNLVDDCQDLGVSFIYASSASVYGLGLRGFEENEAYELPINPYAYSKYLLDQYVRKVLPVATSQIVGLRYFNVYGPGEYHKGAMSSPILKFYEQLKKKGTCELFGGYGEFQANEHRRDFIYVKDCADINYWFMKNREVSGIFNVGSGSSVSFSNVAVEVCKNLKLDEETSIKYVDFPEALKGSYQSYTEANLTSLRAAGYSADFTSVTDGVKYYIEKLERASFEL